MGFNEEYMKLRKKREEEEKESLAAAKKRNTRSATASRFEDEYQQLRAQRIAEEDEDDIAPVLVGASNSGTSALKMLQTAAKFSKGGQTEEKEDEDRKWFEKGAFEDGYQFGDVIKTIAGTSRDAEESVMAGILGIGEKVVDAGATLVGGVGSLFSKDFGDKTKEFVAKDLYDEREVARKLVGTRNLSNLWADSDNSVLGEKSDDILYSGGQLAATLALQTVGVPWYATTGTTSFGAETENAFNNDATYGEAIFSGAVAAGSEILTEKLFGGSGLGEKGLINLAPLTKGISNVAVKALADFGIDILAEGGEEVASEFFSTLGQKLSYEKEDTWKEILSSEDAARNYIYDLGNSLFGKEARERYGEAAVGGMFLGGFMNASNVTRSARSGRDYRTELSKNEKSVFDKEYADRLAEAEKSGETLTKKDKGKIYDEVMEDLKKGQISTDTIEEVLGGESYKSYRDTVESEDATLKEFEELGKVTQPSLAQQARYTELQEKVKEIKEGKARGDLKTKLTDTVRGLLTRDVKGRTQTDDFLLESYNEQTRRGKVFGADIEQYDEKEREVVQKAIDSGILNDTRRTHEFVGTIAKISAQTGTPFDFTNNAKLKESGFAVEGADINGVYTKDGIKINMDSHKAWQSTVGHEITHVLEGTELYTQLQSALFDYAKSKNDYQGRYDTLTKLYKGVEGANVDAELTADLVGDYLFTDADFVNHLSTKNRNVFQRVYDEIKHLLKMVTAGSKEARQLEQVKRAFDKAYKAGGKGAEGTKYSISDSTGKQLTSEQQKYFADSKMRDENGNLKVMYHGSQDAGFHVFDPSKSDDDISLFFVDRNDVAASYSGTSETYEAQTIRSAEDMNRFIESIGAEGYEVTEQDGKYTLLYEGERVADSNTAQGIYDEFCWYEGVGEGDANYKVYLNLKNPLEVDAEGRNWHRISSEFSQEIYDRYQTLTAEEKAALTDLTEWEDFSLFNQEIESALQAVSMRRKFPDRLYAPLDENTKNLASAFEKIKGNDNVVDFYSLFDIAADSFTEETIRENSVKQLNTRDYAKRAKEGGYDGVIFKNLVDVGGYSNGDEGASTVAIAFSSEQVKSVANGKPTSDPDIRYSLTEYTAEEKKAHNDAVLEHFGKTYKWAETGYLLLDGTRLDLSGKHDGAPGGYRTVDHRDITDALGYDYGGGEYSDSLIQFMSEGNIRIVPEIGGINLSVKPTKAQEQALSDFISRNRGEVVLDIDDSKGNTIVSVEYPKGTYFKKVLEDIREWFDNGKQPEVSGLSQFRSLSTKGEAAKVRGRYATPARDLRYEGKPDIAPVQESVQDAVPEGFAPIPEEAATAISDEGFASLTDADMPPEIDEQYGAQRDAITLDDEAVRGVVDRVTGMLGLDAEDAARMAETVQEYAQNPDMTDADLFNEVRDNFKYHEEYADESDTELKSAKDHIRGTHLFVPENLKGDFDGRRADGFNAFRREHFGHFHLTTNEASNAIGVDALYAELTELYPDLFPADIWNAADQLKRIGEVAAMQQQTQTYEGDFDEDTINEVCDIIRSGVEQYSQSETARLASEDANSFYDSIGAVDIAPVAANVAQPDRAYEAIRPPKQSSEPRMKRVKDGESGSDKPERRWVRTSTESDAVGGIVTPDDIPDDVRYYQVKSNKKTLATANERLARDGYAKSREYFEGKMTERNLSVEDIALGERLIQEAAKAGDTQAVRDLIIDVSIIGTELGQRVQALSLIRRLTPEGQLKALTRTVERGKAKGDKAFNGVEITQEMIDYILKTYGSDGTFDQAELNAAVEDVKKQIADQMTVGTMDYINAWRYLSMLGNPKTHIRNIVSNVAMMGTRAVKNVIARTGEDIFLRGKAPTLTTSQPASKATPRSVIPNGTRVKAADRDNIGTVRSFNPATGKYSVYFENDAGHNATVNLDAKIIKPLHPIKKTNAAGKAAGGDDIAPVHARTKTWKKATEAVKAFAKQTTKEMETAIKGETKYSEVGSIKAKRKMFKTAAVNAVNDFNSNALEGEDFFFSKPAFEFTFREYLTANGVKTDADIKNNPELVEKAKDYALDEARKATFRQDSYLANMINEIEQKHPFAGLAIGSTMPFKKTPINIAKTGVAYSPLGFARNIYDAVQVKKGNMDASEAIDHLAQTLTGTSLTLIGFALASMGALNGAGSDDKEGKYDYQLGKQSYSFNFGGDTFSLSWLTPVSMPLFVGANAFEKLVEKEEWDMNVVIDTLAQTLDPLSEMSFLSSLDDVLSSYDSGVEKIWGAGESMLQNYATQFIPTLSSQIAAVADDTKRSTKASGTSGFEFGEETLRKIAYKIPGLRNKLEPTTDIWGNDYKQTENLFVRAFEQFLSPANRRAGISTDVDEELKSLYGETGDTTLIPSIPYDYINYDGVKYDMSAKEYTEYKQTYGQTALDLMEQLFATETYKAATSEERADMVGRVYDYARDKAKLDYFRGLDVDYTNATEDNVEVYKENPIKGAIEADLPVDEYTFSQEYPAKYSFFKSNGISYDTYKAADEDGKSAYTWAYENPGKYTMSKAISDDFMEYYGYKSAMNDFDAKDANGETVSGLKKERVAEYINGLDLDYGQRIILYRSMYDSKADREAYNMDIIDYLNSREDISYDEMKTILEELGMTVDSKGNIYWD